LLQGRFDRRVKSREQKLAHSILGVLPKIHWVIPAAVVPFITVNAVWTVKNTAVFRKVLQVAKGPISVSIRRSQENIRTRVGRPLPVVGNVTVAQVKIAVLEVLRVQGSRQANLFQ